MSDRIAYVVGNSADRDHINWPTILRSEIPNLTPFPPDPDQYDLIWPVDVTLAQVMAMAWRVKKWKLTGTVSASLFQVFIDPAPDTTQSVSGSAELEATDLGFLRFDNDLSEYVFAVREQEIVNQVYSLGLNGVDFVFLGTEGGISFEDAHHAISNWNTSSDTRGNFSGSTPETGPAALKWGMLDTYPTLYDPGTKKFSPPFSTAAIGNLIPAVFAGNQLVVRASFNRNPPEVTSGTFPVNLSSPGSMTVSPKIAPDFTIPMTIGFGLAANENGDVLSGSASGEFMLEAVEFWPCKDSAGNPVYDSTTGAQLTNPLG